MQRKCCVELDGVENVVKLGEEESEIISNLVTYLQSMQSLKSIILEKKSH